MNRKHLIPGLLLALLLALVCASCALAAEDPLKITMALSNNQFSEPKEITVSISVSNVGESDLPGPVTLYYPSGKQVEDFGSPVLAVGTSKSWTGSWKVTQEQLEKGKLTFKVKYSIYDDDGELVNKTKYFSKTLIYSGAEPELTVNRTIRPTLAQKGQEITITYDIQNTGTSDVTGVTIKENSTISSKTGTIDAIAAGEKASYTFTVTMGTKSLTSSATITFKAGGKSYTQKVEAAEIRYGEVKLSVTAKTDKKGGAPGDKVKLTTTLKNTGTVDFSHVRIADDNLGELYTDLTVKAGETLTLENDITVTESQDIQLLVTAEDGTGVPVETASGKVSIIATDPTQAIVLSVEAKADRKAVYEIPGSVHFTITVNNESAVDVKDITIRAVDTVINTYALIPAGESKTFTREMAVSMAGTYQFTASCSDQLGQTLRFASNEIKIKKAKVTAEPTAEPVITPQPPVYETVPQSYEELDESKKLPAWTDQVEEIAGRIKWVLVGITAVLVVLLLIGAVRRIMQKVHSGKAMDHLEGANYRDYSTEPKRNRRSQIYAKDTEEPAKKPEEKEDTAQESELMAETLQRLYRESATPAQSEASGAAETAGDAAETQAPETAGGAEAGETTGRHRRNR